jgi:hypothetical protein
LFGVTHGIGRGGPPGARISPPTQGLDVAMRVLTALAERDGTDLHLPSLWERADPWAGI